ncbi:MAG: type I methionyl aminopeptidase [Thermoleophilia bacterium]|nr:type I methionyl aminopeptidase [Thermoleophilia bacterium]
MINLKTPEQIEKMAASGRVQARALQLAVTTARPGATTAEIDAAVEKFIRSQGGVPSFKGYKGFPGSICASINDMVVHGIPGPQQLEKGDLISIDVGVTLDGWVSDAALTVPVGGEAGAVAQSLLDTTKQSLFDAVEQCRVGNRLGDVSHAVQKRVEGNGFSVIRELIGHGVGREMHEEPQVPNYGEPGTGPELKAGMVIAIEPMVNVGGPGITMGDDGWAVYSSDGSLSAHFEFTVAITRDGPRILTPWHKSSGTIETA